jgi:hypothetical protein
VKFLKEHAIEPNSKMTYAQLLHRHIYPYIGKRRVAEISRETIHRLLTVVLPELCVRVRARGHHEAQQSGQELTAAMQAGS